MSFFSLSFNLIKIHKPVPIVTNLSDFIINHHEEHEEDKHFFIFVSFVFFVVKKYYSECLKMELQQNNRNLAPLV